VFEYEVARIELVRPTQVDVMEPTPDPTLTLITCGGEFDQRTRTFSHRLVVQAKLVGSRYLE
jgi:sortase A